MDVKKFYEEIGGNYSSALSIMMNDILIERMIHKFMSNNVYNDIIKASEEKAMKQVFALSHSFKGVTGNLALTPLFELSSKITELTRNNENADIDEEIKMLKEKYELIERAYNNLK